VGRGDPGRRFPGITTATEIPPVGSGAARCWRPNPHRSISGLGYLGPQRVAGTREQLIPEVSRLVVSSRRLVGREAGSGQ
jgi:hypothetical protein